MLVELTQNNLVNVDGGVSIKGVVAIICCTTLGSIGGALTGGVAGAGVGSVVPVIGTTCGAYLGAIGGAATGVVGGALSGVTIVDMLEW